MSKPDLITAPPAAIPETSPQRLPPDGLSALQSAFNAKIQQKLDRNLPANIPAEDRQALEQLLRDSIAARHEIGDAALRDIAQAGKDMARKIKAQRKAFAAGTNPFSLTQKFRIAAGAKFRNADENVASIFGADDRLYLPLGLHLSTQANIIEGVRADVAGYLATRGYRITDYANGYATDGAGKQKFRIGKILNGNPDLQKRFIADSARVAHKMLAVVSRDTMDIARMSANRGWQSCMTPGGQKHHYVARDVARGTLVAYLVTEGDPGINDPLARILLKPYRCNGATAYRPDKPYGLGNEAFSSAIEDFAHQLNRAAPAGVYRLDKWLYADDTQGCYIHRAEEFDAETFLRAIGKEFTKTQDGILVNGGIDISNMGLRRLPDLSDVTVTGNFDCSHNKLESLVGLPKSIGGDLVVGNNRLTSLEGCPSHVGRGFLCWGNLLTSLRGGPSTVGGIYMCSQNKLESLEGAPEIVPHTFYCEDNPALKSLKGGPRETGYSYRCDGSGIEALDGAPEKFGGLSGSNFAFSSPEMLAAFMERTGGSLAGLPVRREEQVRQERRRRLGL